MPPTPTETGTVDANRIVNTVPVRRVLISGIILGIFHPPIIGFVYALCFAFTKTTRRVAMWVAIWTIAWTLIYGFTLGFVAKWIKPSSTNQHIQTVGKVLSPLPTKR